MGEFAEKLHRRMASKAHLLPTKEPKRRPGELLPGGIKDVAVWIPLALRALILDRSAYREVANNPRMTGPGLLLGLVFSLLSASIVAGSLSQFAYGVLGVIVAWFVAILAVYIVGHVLARRGYFTRTMRTLGFARVLAVISLLAIVPNARGVILVLYLLIEFLALWMASSEAHILGGWRSLLLPVLAILLIAIIPLLLVALLTSAVAGLESALLQLGLVGAP